MPQYINQYGLNANGQGKKEPSEWEKYLQQAKLAMSMDGETALGLALGKAIRYFWDKHLAERNESQDRAAQAAKRHNENVQQGYDLESWAKNGGLGTIGGYEGNVPYTPTPINAESAPAQGVAWEKYAEANGLPGSKDYRQESIERVMPTTQFNPGALTTDDLVAALDRYNIDPNRKPVYFGGGF